MRARACMRAMCLCARADRRRALYVHVSCAEEHMHSRASWFSRVFASSRVDIVLLFSMCVRAEPAGAARASAGAGGPMRGRKGALGLGGVQRTAGEHRRRPRQCCGLLVGWLPAVQACDCAAHQHTHVCCATMTPLPLVPSAAQLIGMSATIPNLADVAKWLGAVHYETKFRWGPGAGAGSCM